ncbi:hypothetical protein [uncultured Acetatifactor sp.]|uniref:hypothetical protein n=1 Tax=uncultured Acetatifactor sp. TaxID=1671927 RepID=UPI00260C64CC|nr:hypothetical protein [uncultured Acetatifactor sp.]
MNDTSTAAYRLLSLTALSGECSPDILSRLGIGPSYGEKLVTKLKDEGLLKTHYKDRLRGYRLACGGKKLLLAQNPERFSFYLSGNTETNHPRSGYPRRLRLQQASHIYAMLLNAGITFFRDEKPLIFREEPQAGESVRMPLPIFYHSREVKELGTEAVKIGNSRIMGILFAPGCIYALFHTGTAPIKWEYQTELRVKTFLSHHISRGILSRGSIEPCYHPDTPIRLLFIGSGMDTALKLMESTGGFQKSYFCLDSSFDYFHYVPDDAAGETTLRLLCSPALQKALRSLLLSDLEPPCPDYGLEHDAVSEGMPVLLAFDFDMLRLSRFRTALSFHGLAGNLVCFDFQKPVLQQYFGDAAAIETIDLYKFERRFLH